MLITSCNANVTKSRRHRLSTAGAERRAGVKGLLARRTRRGGKKPQDWDWAVVEGVRASRRLSACGRFTPGQDAAGRLRGSGVVGNRGIRAQQKPKTDRRRFRLGRLMAHPERFRFGRRLCPAPYPDRDTRLAVARQAVRLILMWLLMACGLSYCGGGGPFVCCAGGRWASLLE